MVYNFLVPRFPLVDFPISPRATFSISRFPFPISRFPPEPIFRFPDFPCRFPDFPPGQLFGFPILLVDLPVLKQFGGVIVHNFWLF